MHLKLLGSNWNYYLFLKHFKPIFPVTFYEFITLYAFKVFFLLTPFYGMQQKYNLVKKKE